MTAYRTFRLTKEDAEEVLHKLSNLEETQDLMDDYGVTEVQVHTEILKVPRDGGEWTVGEEMLPAILGEMKDHCIVLLDIAHDARNGGKPGEALRISKQVKRLEQTFAA